MAVNIFFKDISNRSREIFQKETKKLISRDTKLEDMDSYTLIYKQEEFS